MACKSCEERRKRLLQMKNASKQRMQEFYDTFKQKSTDLADIVVEKTVSLITPRQVFTSEQFSNDTQQDQQDQEEYNDFVDEMEDK